MNYKIKKRFVLVILTILLTNMIYGCKNKIEDREKLQINSGSIVIENNDNYKVYNLNNNEYEIVETNYVITSYDSKSNNFIFSENGNFKVDYLGEEKVIDNTNDIFSPKLSPGGEYLSYFVKDIYLNLKVKDLKEDEYLDVNSKVSISGELIDWLDSETLVYYGIDDNKNNGIFIYDIKSDEEKFIYKLDAGYIEYLKVLENGVVFLQEKEGKQKSLKFINKNGDLSESIDNVVEISDVEYTDSGIYIIGKIENNNYSLYQYNNGKMKRLVYDFPKIINLDKGLSKDINGNILFVGGEEPSIERVYICEDGTISELSNNEGNYYFINYH